MSDDGDDRASVDEKDCVEPDATGDEGEDFSPWDEDQEAFAPKPIPMQGGEWTANEDELPTPIVDENLADAHAPVFSHDNQVCIADLRKFVLRDRWGGIVAEFAPDDVTRTDDGTWVVATSLALRVAKEQLDAHKKRGELDTDKGDPWLLGAICSRHVLMHDGGYGTQSVRWDDAFFAVEPVRPACKHYLRQLEPNAPSVQLQGFKKGTMRRYCSVRRTVAGAFMGLTDGAMKACSMRSPHDADTEAHLDDFDVTLIKRGEERQHLPMFNLQQDADEAQGGIFKGDN